MAQRLVVVGAGISGLAAACAAREVAQEAGRGGDLEIVVLESGGDVGGKARTVARPGWLVETGPTGYLDNEPVLERLVGISGLAKLPATPEAARRYLVRGDRLREIRPHPLKFASSGILSPLGVLRMAGDLFIGRRQDGGDESVWNFARRRLGRQAADRMIAPMVLGVFAGDAKRISLASAFPRMAQLEREHRSLFKALAAVKRSKRESGGPAGPSGRLTSFADGLQSLPRALAGSGRFEVRTAARVSGLEWDDTSRRWQVGIEGADAIRADSVLLAAESWATAAIVRDAAPDVASALLAIDCPPVAVVALGYGREALARCPRGFGALIPRNEGYRILGVLWDTHLFAGRSADGTLLMRAMLGGTTDPGIADLPPGEVTRIAEADVARLLGLTAPPVFRETKVWPRAIPQYEIGHAGRESEIDAALAASNEGRPGLLLAGNYMRGIAFGKSAANGWEQGRAAAASVLALAPARSQHRV